MNQGFVMRPCPANDPVLVNLVVAQRREMARTDGNDFVDVPLHDGAEFQLAVMAGEAVGCGAVQPLGPGVGEIKRMYVRPEYRGLGLSRRILASLEEYARRSGVHTLRLESCTALQIANRLYTSSGYKKIPQFGEYVGQSASICYEKRL
jgi:GNAT superfamily N-acetyltransferase